ncbi:MAG: hypothetical protein IIY16_07105 [Oscillospiraceae bacterium]|nr:hypothetical protein [Oscillospiraceae bacterium]
MKQTLRAVLSFSAVILGVLYLLTHAAEAAKSACDAMALSASRVIPALFPLCVAAMFLCERGTAASWRFLSPLMRLFRLEAAAAPACILGWLCGFPVGAALLSDLFSSGQIDKASAERALAFCTCASPAFTVQIAGMMLGSAGTGFLLWGVHLLSAFLTAILTAQGAPCSKTRRIPHEKKPLPAAFTAAVQRASMAMLHVCGFIVLFSVVIRLLEPLMRGNQALRAAAGAILELTNGLQALSACTLSPRGAFMLSAAALGWSGLCVHAQVLSFALPCGLSPYPYLRGKALHSALSLLAAIPVSRLLSQDAVQTAFAVHAPALPLLHAGGLLLLFFYLLFEVLRSIMKKKHMG